MILNEEEEGKEFEDVDLDDLDRGDMDEEDEGDDDMEDAEINSEIKEMIGKLQDLQGINQINKKRNMLINCNELMKERNEGEIMNEFEQE
jgi:hypothetical protein